MSDPISKTDPTPASPLGPRPGALSPPSLRISQMTPGQSGTILDVGLDDGTDRRMNEDGVRRLQELGFVPGETITVVRRGFPGGDPLAVRIGSSLFALRRVEASAVRVLRS